MKPKTIALLTLIALTSYTIEAGGSKTLLELQNQTQTFTETLQKEAKTHLNKTVLALMNTIKFIESDRCPESFETGIVQGNYNAIGLSGEIGAYQIMPTTWEYWCKKFFNEVLFTTEENQDLLVYTVIEDLINRGYSTEEVAATWNSGSPDNWETKVGVNSYGAYYNVPAYVQAFKSIHDRLEQFVA